MADEPASARYWEGLHRDVYARVSELASGPEGTRHLDEQLVFAQQARWEA